MSKKWSVVLLVCALLSALALAGCYRPAKYPVIVTVPHRLVLQRYIIGTSVEGRPIECIVLGQGQDVILVLASMHGSEPAGTPLVRRLAEYLQQHRQLVEGHKVVMVPVANPDGLAHDNRHNARGVDLNRNFSTANRLNNEEFGLSALSEPEARVIERLIRQYNPDRIVSIHQPLECIDYDGPGEALASHIAEHCDLPVRKLGAKLGSLGSYAGVTLGIPIITLELPGGAELRDSQSLWRQYGAALVAAVTYPSRTK